MSLLRGLKENLGPAVCLKLNRGYSHGIINVLLSSHCGVGQVIRMGDSSPSDLGSIPLGEKREIMERCQAQVFPNFSKRFWFLLLGTGLQSQQFAISGLKVLHRTIDRMLTVAEESSPLWKNLFPTCFLVSDSANSVCQFLGI